jgi:hypothetical protein
VAFAVGVISGDTVRPVLEKNLFQLRPGVIFISMVAVMLLMFLVSSAPWLRSPDTWMDRAEWLFEAPNLAVSCVAGVVLAIGLYDLGAVIGSESGNGALLILGGVSVASIAYAMQFVSNQLSWAQEMRGYEDALDIFRRARSALKEIDDSEADPTTRTRRRHAIIVALGKKALEENENWLRTHRERPLEPLPPV